MSYTFVLLKPDAIKRGLVREIFNIFERSGLHAIKQKSLEPSASLIWKMYPDLNPREKFAKEHVKYVSSGKVIAAVLEGKNAVRKAREVVGNKNPEKAAEGTIRRKFGYIDRKTDLWITVVHAADSGKNARREAKLFGLQS
ncbi:MAG: nucleoside-diphosphate kinase [Candidatus Diapherotrites archaeon]|nr:nucleoside-diphosphate kinase [Candidatus Diapherotrites archaeon]